MLLLLNFFRGVILRFSVFLLFFCCHLVSSQSTQSMLGDVEHIVVKKKQRVLEVYTNGQLLKTYKISLGFAPVGHKECEGDGKTPEGNYYIASKNSKSQFHLSLKISYPSDADKKAAKKRGVSPGGDIMIHGLGKSFAWMGASHTMRDWTLGCAALTNEEMTELFSAVKVGTSVEIRP